MLGGLPPPRPPWEPRPPGEAAAPPDAPCTRKKTAGGGRRNWCENWRGKWFENQRFFEKILKMKKTENRRCFEQKNKNRKKHNFTTKFTVEFTTEFTTNFTTKFTTKFTTEFMTQKRILDPLPPRCGSADENEKTRKSPYLGR